uniref:B-cell receptor CD22 n=1 Tax=Erpetoichthys calabaricus TaxID=27687 RepID=A0A8C4XGK6_ERPCA
MKATYLQMEICALMSSSLVINCTYEYPDGLPIVVEKWTMNSEQDDGQKDVTVYHTEESKVSPSYQHRAVYLGSNNSVCSLRIHDVTRSDRGLYRFRFESIEERNRWTQVPDVVVDVAESIKADIVASSATVIKEGDKVALVCNSSCSLDQVPLVWYKDGKEESGRRSNVLPFAQISYTDAGVYFCADVDNRQVRSQEVSLDVLYAPKETVASVNPGQVILEGTPLHLSCSSKANPPCNYSWFKENGGVSMKTGSEQKLRIETATSSDSGVYYCQATNGHGQETSRGVTVDVAYAPRRTQVTSSVPGLLLEGTSVTLTCMADANPAGTYAWFKVNGDTTAEKATGRSWSFTAVTPSDGGVYYCEARNRHGEEKSKPVTLDVQYAPKNTTVTSSVPGPLLEGTSVTLTCMADANPAGTYAWFKVNGDTTAEKATGRSWSFTAVTPSDGGVYYCEARNQHGEEKSKPVTLDVQYAPKNTTVTSSVSGLLLEGTSVTLTCMADANPAGTYAWFKVNGDTTAEKATGRSWSFTAVTPSDGGVYYCEARNRHGEEKSKPVTLDVQYSPKMSVMPVSLSVAMLEGSSVTLLCGPTAIPDASGSSWFHVTGRGVSRRADADALTLTSVTPADSGLYYCTRSSGHTADNATALILDVQYAPKNTVMSMDPGGSILEGDTVTLSCSSVAKPLSNYSWYQVKGAAVIKRGSAQNLTLVTVTPSDGGMYYCQAANQHGGEKSPARNVTVLAWSSVHKNLVPREETSTGGPLLPRTQSPLHMCKIASKIPDIGESAQQVMDVHDVPQVTVDPPGRLAEGSSVTLSCQSKDSLPGLFTWFHVDGVSISNRGSGQNLTIRLVAVRDSGAYFCEMTNKNGAENSTAVTLHVHRHQPKTILYALMGTIAFLSIGLFGLFLALKMR